MKLKDIFKVFLPYIIILISSFVKTENESITN